jgi:hypothetical protein
MLNGMVNPNGSMTNAVFEYGETATYGNRTSNIEVSPGTNPVPVEANIIGLKPNTTYHFRLSATNNDGTEYGDDESFITAVNISAPTVVANAESNIGTNSVTLNATVNANGDSTTVRFNYGITTAYGMDTLQTVGYDFNGTVSVTINNLSPNTTYHYQAVAMNSVGTSNSGNQCFRTLPGQNQTITLAHTVSFPSRPAQSDYKIIGIPGVNNLLSIKNFLTGVQGKDWEAYRDDGADDFIKFRDDDPLFKLGVGRAFWVISKNNMTITGTPFAVQPISRAATITLDNSGWNLITNPFDFNIAWKTIQDANETTQPLYTYDKGLKTSPCFEPYIGYYFYNFNATGAQLKIPFVPSCSDCPETAAPTAWRITITLNAGELIDQTNSLGAAPEAREGLDQLDLRKPRVIAATPTVYFARPEWDARYSTFATDIRPEFEDVQYWDFDVRAIPREAALLTFSGLSKVPVAFEVFLIDESKGRVINLRADSLYRFTPATEMNKFAVVVGNKASVQEKLNTVAPPTTFALGPNYPNPFSVNGTFGNSETMIPVAIATTSAVKLQVFNTLGQEVRTLYDGTLEAGKYWFSWDGRNRAAVGVATGVYLYRLTTNTNVVLTKKMILLR